MSCTAAQRVQNASSRKARQAGGHQRRQRRCSGGRPRGPGAEAPVRSPHRGPPCHAAGPPARSCAALPTWAAGWSSLAPAPGAGSLLAWWPIHERHCMLPRRPHGAGWLNGVVAARQRRLGAPANAQQCAGAAPSCMRFERGPLGCLQGHRPHQPPMPGQAFTKQPQRLCVCC